MVIDTKPKSNIAFTNIDNLQLLEDLQEGMNQGDADKKYIVTEVQFQNSKSKNIKLVMTV